MTIATIVSELKTERARIDDAIEALEGLSHNGTAKRAHSSCQKSSHMSAAGRKRISEMMKKRWAEHRKKLAAKK